MSLPPSSKISQGKGEDAPATMTQNAEAVAHLDYLYEQPELAAQLSQLRERAFAVLERNVTELVKTLGEEEAVKEHAELLQNINSRLLTTRSRQSSKKVAARRQFARDILISWLINEHNSEWDMTDATTYQTEIDNLIVLLMQRPAPH